MTTQNAINLQDVGIATYDGVGNFASRVIVSGDGLYIINGDGVVGNPTLSSAAIPVGFEDPSNDAQISFVNGTRTLTVSPQVSAYSYWSDGARYTKNGSESIVITNTEGLHYVYFDGATLTSTTTFSTDIITKYAIVAIIYWDATNSKQLYLGQEHLHTREMSGLTHASLHQTRGFALDTGGALTDFVTDASGALASHAQFGNEATIAWDEDARFSYSARTSTANIAVYYRSGADASNIWRIDESASFGVLTTGTGRAAYNQNNAGTWQQTEVTNNQFVLAHVFVMNDSDREFGVVQGQADYATLTAARDGAETEIVDIILEGLPTAEFKFLGTIIYQTSNSYGNAVKSRTRTVNVAGDDYIDLRDFGVTRGGVSSSLTDHGALTGLGDDDHTQYLLADGSRALAGAWDMGSQATTNVNITSGSISGITDLAVADGGTGASNAGDARTNLGLVIGTNVQAWDAQLDDIAALAVTDGNFIVGNGSNWVAESGATARTSLGLGTIATQDANNVTISGGSITGITDLAVADGGTGASTLTDHGVLVGSGTSAVTALAVGTNGQVLVGSTGADPVFATITSTDASITITGGAGTLDLQVAGSGGGAWEYVGTYTISGDASIDIEDLSTDYSYEITVDHLVPGGDGDEIYFRMSNDNGTSFQSSGYWYSEEHVQKDAQDDSGSNNIAYIPLSQNDKIGTGTGERFYCRIWLYDVTNASNPAYIRYETAYISNLPDPTLMEGMGVSGTSNFACDAVQIYGNENNLGTGTIRLFRQVHS